MSKFQDLDKSAKFHEAIESLQNASEEKRAELTKKLSELYENALHSKDEAIQKIKEGARHVDTSVHQNPWPYIAGAAIGGLLIGLLIRSRE